LLEKEETHHQNPHKQYDISHTTTKT